MKRGIWLTITFGSLGIAVVTSYLMIARTANQELWGHLPLFQLLSSWCFIFFLLARKSLQDQGALVPIGLSTLSGVFLALGFPPFPLTFLLFLGFVPLLLALDKIGQDSFKKRFLLIYHALILWNILATSWVANTGYAAGVFANTVNALFMSVPIIAYLFIRKRLGSNVGLISFASTWLAFEFLHIQPWDLYWPWLTLGNALSKIHWAVQWYEYTGVFGGSAWILFVNYLAYSSYQEPTKRRNRITWIAVLVLLPITISLIRYFTWNDSDASDAIEVVAVQPNFEPHYEKFRVPQEVVFERMQSLAQPLLTNETDYLVMPETSFSSLDMNRVEDPGYLVEFDRILDQFPNLKIITGLASYRVISDPGEYDLPTSRPRLFNGDTLYLEYYNNAIQIESSSEVQAYYKALFVPGAEYFPFKRALFFLKPIVDQLGGTSFGYRTLTHHTNLHSDQAVIAPPICYESIFGEFVNEFIRRGAQTIFVMTNDGWWDNTAGHRQHAQYAKLRAIESRRSVTRAANLGTTCFINARGDISQPTVYHHANAIKGTVKLYDKQTFYVRWGDVIGRIALFIAGLLLIRSLVVRITQGG